MTSPNADSLAEFSYQLVDFWGLTSVKSTPLKSPKLLACFAGHLFPVREEMPNQDAH